MQKEITNVEKFHYLLIILHSKGPKDQNLQEIMGNGENVFTFWQKEDTFRV